MLDFTIDLHLMISTDVLVCYQIKRIYFLVSAAFTSSSFDVYEGEEVQICVQLSALQGQLVAEFSMDIAVENGKHLNG